jgi:transcriptional regulator with XRE-family HTH domain
VSTSPSSSAQAARKRLADQIRRNAKLTGDVLAERAGWSAGKIKVSRIENAARPISADDLRTWCAVCGVPSERAEELLAEQRAAEAMWTTYKRLHGAGLRVAQESVRDIYEGLRILRGYQTRGAPGLLQTADYTRRPLPR